MRTPNVEISSLYTDLEKGMMILLMSGSSFVFSDGVDESL